MKGKYNTHTIIKNEDVDNYLSEEQKMQLQNILCTIGVGRVKDDKNGFNSYYLCNKDEPYAEGVLQLILKGEEIKIAEK